MQSPKYTKSFHQHRAFTHQNKLMAHSLNHLVTVATASPHITEPLPLFL